MELRSISNNSFRDYQIRIANEGVDILRQFSIVYLAMQVRTGKTLTSLRIAHFFSAKKVLFLTKKKSIDSICEDFEKFQFGFELIVVNNESVHKVSITGFDLIISDEHHRNGAFPKPNATTKFLKQKFGHLPFIFLSGTPTPESYSQIFHQFWISNKSPFIETNFYSWAKKYVDVKQKYLGYANVNDYSHGKKKEIFDVVGKYFIRYTQEQAGFKSVIKENIIEVDIDERTRRVIDMLKRDRVVYGRNNNVILADTGVKLQSKIHQLFSGTIKFENGESMILDFSKANFIKQYYQGKKIAIFYKFRQEFEALKRVFGDLLCDNLNEFNSTDKNIALQIVSGREGISLKMADRLVYYNIDFSAVSYWQSRDRLTTIERHDNQIDWIFSKGGIEKNIYNCVMNKQDYTLSQFKKDYSIRNPNKEVKL